MGALHMTSLEMHRGGFSSFLSCVCLCMWYTHVGVHVHVHVQGLQLRSAFFPNCSLAVENGSFIT